QEQNSFPGITTRKLAPHATHVFLGFGGAGSLISTKGQVTVSGNPVRQSLLGGDRNEAMRHFGLDPSKRTILIIGGSQGSRPINRAITRGLLDESLPESCQLLWQTGRLDHDQIVSELGDRAKGHTLFAFSNEMRLVYAAADIAIARAGALTIAELEACGVPAILVPYPFAAGDHQRKNADEYAGRGVAVVVDQKELDREDVLRRAADALQDGTADRMRAALTQQQRSEPAVDVIANGIIDLIQREHSAGGIGDN
ncbi:hypothetical protein GF420_05525, partial [candidate division GN15 bacterium]|nr:hypothetical protein [candidate division GN15 bacterium]